MNYLSQFKRHNKNNTGSREFRTLIINIILSLIFMVIIPTFIFFQVLASTISRDLLNRTTFLTIFTILLGAMSISFLLLGYAYLNPLSRVNLIFIVGKYLSYMIYIFCWSRFLVIQLGISDFFIIIDLSLLSVPFYLIPILLVTQYAYTYTLDYLNSKKDVMLLDIIKDTKHLNKTQAKKKLYQQFGSSFNISLKLTELERKGLIQITSNYNLTSKGNETLNWFKNHRRSIFLDSQADIKYIKKNLNYRTSVPLQVWTEEELEKFNKNKCFV